MIIPPKNVIDPGNNSAYSGPMRWSFSLPLIFWKFSTRGHACAISIPHARETLNAPWKPAGLYLHVLSRPERGAHFLSRPSHLLTRDIKGARKTDEFRNSSLRIRSVDDRLRVCFFFIFLNEGETCTQGRKLFFLSFCCRVEDRLWRIDCVDVVICNLILGNF